jgi:hypothetical protein
VQLNAVKRPPTPTKIAPPYKWHASPIIVAIGVELRKQRPFSDHSNYRDMEESSGNFCVPPSTYVVSGVAVEGARVDLHIGTTVHKGCSALLSWMSPEHGGKFRKILETTTHSLT